MENAITEGDIVEYTQYGDTKHALIIEVHPKSNIMSECYRCQGYNLGVGPFASDFWLLSWNIIKKVDHNGQPIYNTWDKLLTV